MPRAQRGKTRFQVDWKRIYSRVEEDLKNSYLPICLVCGTFVSVASMGVEAFKSHPIRKKT